MATKLCLSKLRDFAFSLGVAGHKSMLWRSYCAASPIRSSRIQVNGVNLYYEISGDSPDVVLCIPGVLGTTQSNYGPQLRGLSEDFTVVSFDPRGYGKSIPPKREFQGNFFEQDAEDAAEFVYKLGLKKFSILGWSGGGMVSIMLAAARPKMVEKMVLWGSNAYVAEEVIAVLERHRDLSKWPPERRAPLEDLYGEDKIQGLWTSWINAYINLKKEENGICKSSLQNIECPTLIIHGSKDPIIPDFHAVYIHERIKNSQIHYFPEGRHDLHLMFPGEFNDVVTKFLLTKEKRYIFEV